VESTKKTIAAEFDSPDFPLIILMTLLIQTREWVFTPAFDDGDGAEKVD
jgi:hypothetical protein